MAKIDHIERRLLNWARWKAGAGAGGLGYSSVQLGETPGGTDGYRESVIPTLDCEAEETDRAVVALPSELRATVEAVYVGAGGMAAKAAKLCVSVPTLHERVGRAHRLISNWLVDQDAARRLERDRYTALQQEMLAGRERL